jgi:hypothetical protein
MRTVYSYPTPEKNPHCVCPNMMVAFFCQTGHSTECHYGMSCDKASCSHLPRYEFEWDDDNYAVEDAPLWKVEAQNQHGDRVLEISVYAPDQDIVRELMAEWIEQTENLSRMKLRYLITRDSGPDGESAKYVAG